jgi:hypothetical protein
MSGRTLYTPSLSHPGLSATIIANRDLSSRPGSCRPWHISDAALDLTNNDPGPRMNTNTSTRRVWLDSVNRPWAQRYRPG